MVSPSRGRPKKEIQRSQRIFIKLLNYFIKLL